MLENMLDYIRFALYGAIIVLGFLLFQAWEKQHPTALTTVAQNSVANAPVDIDRVVPDAPVAAQATEAAKVAAAVPAPVTGKLVHVTTDVLKLTIDTRGGDIIESQLLNYPESLHSKQPFLLLNDDAKTRYLAESGLLSKEGPDTAQAQAAYDVAQTEYVMNPGEDTLTVKLNWKKDGVNVTKVFTFARASYEVKVAYELDNQSNKTWEGNFYTQLLRTNNPPPSHQGFMSLATYFGAAISTPQKPFEKIPFKDMNEKNLNRTVLDGYVAMIQHYFVSAWVPPKTATSNYYSRVSPSGLYTIGMIGPQLSAAPGQKVSAEAKLYTGPAIASELEKSAPGLQLTIDYGWFWFISGIIFWMLSKIHDVIGNWGWSIVIVTIIIKLMFYQLSAKSYRSMSAMKRLQPKIEALKQRYADDKQKMTQATLDLYRQEKVNPMSGCLPILIQIPVFIALYWVLVESVQLRQAPWILWIHDLSVQDPYYILPVFMGISMFIQQKLNPPPADPMQAKVMLMMPIIFSVMFANFPAGLMLYWFVNNTLSVLQQWHIMRKTNSEAK